MIRICEMEPDDTYFMGIALMASTASKDPVTKVGACIINQRKVVVGLGYNSMARGCGNFPWGKDSLNVLENKKFYVCHAEMNAILNNNCTSLEGCSIYVALFPCNECAKCIIQSGIKEVIFLNEKDNSETLAAKLMFDAAIVNYRKLHSKNLKVEMDFRQKQPIEVYEA